MLIADPEKIFRDGLKLILARQPDIRVVGQAATAAEACEKARRIQPDLLLTELAFPDNDGVAAARTVLASVPTTRVAVLSASTDEERAIAALRAGVHGYITKDCSVSTLVDAVRRIAAGEAVIPPRFASRLVEEIAALTRGRDEQLRSVEADRAKVTEREREVLRLLVQGATNHDIASQLVITENTVKVHLRNILEKLHLRNRQQAAAFAISSGLVQLPSHNGAAPARNGRSRQASLPSAVGARR
jgi:DNA-binding NarL/FixJ family response regulator